MPYDFSNFGRLVVTGATPQGDGVIFDGHAKSRVDNGAFSLIDLWAVETIPVPLAQTTSARDSVSLMPPPAGLIVRVGILHPHNRRPADMSEAYAEMGATAAHTHEGRTSDLHATQTVETATVVSGEVDLDLPSGTVRLTQGDTLVQRGTLHAWKNPGDVPAVIIYTMMTAAED